MYCTKCGHEISEGTGYCTECGAPASLGGAISKAVDGTFESAEREIESAAKNVSSSVKGDKPKDKFKPLRTDRGIFKFILLSIVTLGIYDFYFIWNIAHDVNIACGGDGEKTGGLVKYVLLSLITLGFYDVYWEYKLGNRLYNNADRYRLAFVENGTTVIMWRLVGLLLCGLGPLISLNILMKNANSICREYNNRNDPKLQ